MYEVDETSQIQGPMLWFLNIFVEKFSKKIGVFDSKQKAILKKKWP
jgi:hypothetical protein